MKTSKQRITRLLQGCREGDEGAVHELFELMYKELRRLARRQRRNWNDNITMNTTALVHEAYLKFADQSVAGWESKAHFFAAASRAMRHILINYARDRARKKRGGSLKRITLNKINLVASGEISLTEERIDTLILLDDVLQNLDVINPRQSRIVECRFFGGLTIQETANALEVSPATVSRGWKAAQLWLYREMKQKMETGGELNSA